ncbi:MAG: lysophospholipid acyltransferase family protein [Candidatus Binatia bacterium]
MARERRSFGFDQATAERWLGYVRTALWPYFRPQVISAENLPAGRALIVGCHSGVVPYDAACTLVAIHEATGRFARSIGDRFFGRIGFIDEFLRQQGAIVGRPDVVEALLRSGNIVLLFPGGARDMERSYLTQRYRVVPHRGFAPGHGGYIKLALRTGSPIVPLAVVGAEEAHVVLTNFPGIVRVTGLPFAPLVLFPFPLPTKLYIRFGEPFSLPGTAADADDQRRVDQLNVMVRRRVQHLIDDTVRRRRGVIFSTYENGRRAAHGSAARSQLRPRL